LPARIAAVPPPEYPPPSALAHSADAACPYNHRSIMRLRATSTTRRASISRPQHAAQ
jgi:hypothetical protein